MSRVRPMALSAYRSLSRRYHGHELDQQGQANPQRPFAMVQTTRARHHGRHGPTPAKVDDEMALNALP